MSVCVAHRCQEKAARGPLCAQHKRRLDAGGGLPTCHEKAIGETSGHGTFGQIDRNTFGVLCHECGQRFTKLGKHINGTHGMSVREYRREHGLEWLPDGLALPPGQRAVRECIRCGEVHRETTRRCKRCLAEMRALKPPREPRTRWRRLTPAETESLRAADEAELPGLVGSLQLDRVPSEDIRQVLGLSFRKMAARFPKPRRG